MTVVGIKQEGDDLYKQGKYADAILKYTTAIERCTNPVTYDIHLTYSNRSACYMHLNILDKALEDANICVALKPTWAKGHSRKGACLAALNRNREAIECYERVLQLDRSNVEATNAISRLCRDQNTFQQNTSNNSGNTTTSSNPTGSFDFRAITSTVLNSVTSFYYQGLSRWQDLSPNTQLYIQVGSIALILYVLFFRPFTSDYDSGYGYSSSYNYGGYGGYGYGGYGGGMSWTTWGLIMLAAYKVPPMLPDLLGEQYARPFFGMNWTTFMWLLQMFSRNMGGMGGYGRGFGGGYGMPGGGVFGQRRRYY